MPGPFVAPRAPQARDQKRIDDLLNRERRAGLTNPATDYGPGIHRRAPHPSLALARTIRGHGGRW